MAGEPREIAQVAALCYRIRKNKTYQILLVTSRGTGRWILPKGWPMNDRDLAQAAAQEAFEEAGATGKLFPADLGTFKYLNKVEKGDFVADFAIVFPIKVKSLAKNFPERSQRRRRWFSPKKAAAMVREPELKALIKGFRPSSLKEKPIKRKKSA